jgi:hypothetical protein
MNTNLLDFNNDILEMFGENVKQDNSYSMKEEEYNAWIIKYVVSKVREMKEI